MSGPLKAIVMPLFGNSFTSTQTNTDIANQSKALSSAEYGADNFI